MSSPLKFVPKKKPVDIRRREVTVSLIGETLCSMPEDGTLPVDRMIRYWTEAMDKESSRTPDMFVLPEICDVWLGISPERKLEWLDARGDRVLTAFQEYAKKHHAYIVYPTYRDLEGGHHSNCSLLIDREGDLIACYDKAFPTVRDIGVGVIPGHDAVAAETDFGRLSFAICFDIYFHEILDRVAALKPDMIAFSSYCHGGLFQPMWANRCQAYFLGATVGGLGKDIIGPAGEPLYCERGTFRRVTGKINTNFAVAYMDFNREKMEAAVAKYGRKFEMRDSIQTGCVTLLSNDPDLPVMEIVKEFEIELWRDYYARSAAAGADARAAYLKEFGEK